MTLSDENILVSRKQVLDESIPFLNFRRWVLCFGIFYVVFFNYNDLFNDSPFLTSPLNTAITLVFPLILFLTSVFYDRIYIYELVLFTFLIILSSIIIFTLGGGNGYIGEFLPIILYSFASRRIHPFIIVRAFTDAYWGILIGTLLTYFVFNVSQVSFLSRGLLKQSLGFYLPNVLGTVTFVLITLTLIEILTEKAKRSNFIKMGVLFILLFMSGALSAWIATTVAILCVVMLKIGKNKLLMKTISSVIILLSVLTSWWFTSSAVLNNLSLNYKLNNVFNARLFFSYYYLGQFPVKFFGQGLSKVAGFVVGNYTVNLDNNYLYFLLKYGIIFTVLFLLFVLFTIMKAIDSDLKVLLIPILSFAVYGIVETAQGLYYFNYTLMFMGVIFLRTMYLKQISSPLLTELQSKGDNLDED